MPGVADSWVAGASMRAMRGHTTPLQRTFSVMKRCIEGRPPWPLPPSADRRPVLPGRRCPRLRPSSSRREPPAGVDRPPPGWRRGWPGVPRRVELHYAPGIDDTDLLWVPAVVAAVGRRLLADYEVRAHDRRRCRISLRWVPPGPEAEPPPAARVRAERTIGELLGPTAAVTGVRWEHGELAAVDVRHEAATKLSAAGYRHRVERVVSTMLPGRWRPRAG